MKLTPLHIEILRGARKRIEMSEDKFDSFICYAIEYETSARHLAESKLLRNRLLFWRRNSRYEKWVHIEYTLRKAVNSGLSGHTTVGLWFDQHVDRYGIKVADKDCNNLVLYKQIRLAWLDRAIETGVLC
jgi:hypothetical protein